jgi:hypothetical protein
VDGVAPGRVQRSVEANELLVFDSVARHAASLAVQQVRVLLQERKPTGLLRPASMPERAGSDKSRLSTAIRAASVTLPISGSSSDGAMAFRFVHIAGIRLDAPSATRKACVAVTT